MRIVDLRLTIDGLILDDDCSVDDFIDGLDIVSKYPVTGEILSEEYLEEESIADTNFQPTDVVFKVKICGIDMSDKKDFEVFIKETLESILTAEFTQNNVAVESIDNK